MMVLFFPHIPFVVNHTINATPPERFATVHSKFRYWQRFWRKYQKIAFRKNAVFRPKLFLRRAKIISGLLVLVVSCSSFKKSKPKKASKKLEAKREADFSMLTENCQKSLTKNQKNYSFLKYFKCKHTCVDLPETSFENLSCNVLLVDVASVVRELPHKNPLKCQYIGFCGPYRVLGSTSTCRWPSDGSTERKTQNLNKMRIQLTSTQIHLFQKTCQLFLFSKKKTYLKSWNRRRTGLFVWVKISSEANWWDERFPGTGCWNLVWFWPHWRRH